MSILSSKPEISSTPCPTIMSHDMESTKHSFGGSDVERSHELSSKETWFKQFKFWWVYFHAQILLLQSLPYKRKAQSTTYSLNFLTLFSS